MAAFTSTSEQLRAAPKRWLVTGAAGFIGSNLVERLLLLGQDVVGLDSFLTGHRHNIDEVQQAAARGGGRFAFVEGDIRDLAACAAACQGRDIVLHQAALGSVPRSVADPVLTNQCNIDGFLNVLVAARDAEVKRFVYAASSSTYGDHPGLPKVESEIGRPLSPYAVTKYVNELYASVFERTYGIGTVGLRYFNVFGRRQDPNGAYAAVIPRWIGELIAGRQVQIFGDGMTSRDFCYIDNVIQANILAATEALPVDEEHVYNVGYGGQTTLIQLFEAMRAEVARHVPSAASARVEHLPFRAGDVRHSRADISKIQRRFGYAATHSLSQGLGETVDWFVERLGRDRAAGTPRRAPRAEPAAR